MFLLDLPKEIAQLWLQHRDDPRWQLIFVMMGLQDEVPEQKKLPDKQAPGVSESGAKPASAAAGVSGCESSGSGAKPASAAAGVSECESSGSGAKPASAAAGVSGCESSGSGAKPASADQPAPAPKPSADGAGPSGLQPETSADLSTPPKKKKGDPSSPATPAKGKGPKRVKGCRGVPFGQPQEVDTKLKGAKRRNLGSLVQKDLEPPTDGAPGSKDDAHGLDVGQLPLDDDDLEQDEEDIVFKNMV